MTSSTGSSRALLVCLALGFVCGCGSSSTPQAASAPDAGGVDAPSHDAKTIDAANFDAPTRGLPSAPAVYTHHNDNARTGATLAEKTLTTKNVRKDTFGLLYAHDVVGQIYAQPLYAPQVPLPGREPRDLVVVATEHDDVYAFDALDAFAPPIWHRHLGEPVPTGELLSSGYCADLSPEVGITATPVIDPTTATVYVETKEKIDDAKYRQTLHAMDLATGSDRDGSPMEIAAEMPSTNGDGAQDGTLSFDPLKENARAALSLVNGVIWMTFASHCDSGPFHGWVLAYDASTLQQRGVWTTTPEAWAGGIWMSGEGLAADDSGDVYFVSGNGPYDESTTPMELSDSFGRLHLGDDGISLVDWFTPHDQAALESGDIDLGSSGAMLVPNTGWVIGAGKEGKMYVVDRENMGHFNPDDDLQIVQSFQATSPDPPYGHPLFGSPVYWNGHVYLWGVNDQLRQFRILGGEIDEVPEAIASVPAAPMPGGILSLSANGAFGDSAIVWATRARTEAGRTLSTGVLMAFAATDVTQELWNSEMVPDRDDLGTFAKFAPPTIAGGHVYVPTFGGKLLVYGLSSERFSAMTGAPPKDVSP